MSDRGESRKGKELKIDNPESDNSSDSDNDHDCHQDNKLMENAVSNSVAPQKSQPMKRGLSSHYVEKSKSFDNLLDIKTNEISELGKEEDPLNKKRSLIRSQDDLDIGTRRTPNLDMPVFSNNPIQGIPTFNNMETVDLDSIFPLLPSNTAAAEIEDNIMELDSIFPLPSSSNTAAENEDNIMDLDSIFPLLPSNNPSAANEDNIRMDDLSDGRNEVGFEDITLDDLDRVLETEYNHEDGISLDDLNGELKFEYNYEDCLTMDDLNDGNFYVGLGHDDDDDEENKENHNSGDDQSDGGNKDDEHDHDADDEENKEIHNSADDQSDKGNKDDEHDHDDEENEIHNSADDLSDKGKNDGEQHDADDEENKEINPKST